MNKPQVKDFDREVIALRKFLQSRLEKLEKEGDEIKHGAKIEFLGNMIDFVELSDKLNHTNASRISLIVRFVERMRYAILEEDKMPLEIMPEQAEEFEKIWGDMVEHYDQAVKDYYPREKKEEK